MIGKRANSFLYSVALLVLTMNDGFLVVVEYRLCATTTKLHIQTITAI